MKIHKTSLKNRTTYTYIYGDGSKVTIHPGENGVTEADIKHLHALDDCEVYFNLKNMKPPRTAQQKVWEDKHPDENALKNWTMSLNQFTSSDDGDSTEDRNDELINPESTLFFDPDESPEVQRLREIIVGLTPRQQELYRLVVLEGHTFADIARAEGVSDTAVRHRMGKIIAQIKKKMDS